MVKQALAKILRLTLHSQYGGAPNMFSAFCLLLTFGFSIRINLSCRINKELFIFNQQRHRADGSQNIANASTLATRKKNQMKQLSVTNRRSS
jgi:hypothetical protein